MHNPKWTLNKSSSSTKQLEMNKGRKYIFWLEESENNILTNPEGAQAFGMEFPVSAPWVIQGKNPPVQWHLEIVCTQ